MTKLTQEELQAIQETADTLTTEEEVKVCIAAVARVCEAADVEPPVWTYGRNPDGRAGNVRVDVVADDDPVRLVWEAEERSEGSGVN